MPIIACGVSHKTAPVELREKLMFSTEKISLYLQDLLSCEHIREAVLLSTCNRSEIYCHADEAIDLRDWFCRQHQINTQDLGDTWYVYQDQLAIEHMMKVACGLDSMVLGEPEILGQMKEAFSESCAAGSVGAQFNRLFQQIFTVSKEVRTNTTIGACPVSIASAAVNLAKQVIPFPLKEANVLLIGAGDTIRLVLRHLHSQQVEQITIANRNVEAAQTLSQKVVSLNELPQVLNEVDLVISATNSPAPIVTQQMLTSRTKALQMIDIAVPRDVAPNVAELNCIQLFSIDDLKTIIAQNKNGREHAAQKALEMIQQKSQEYLSWLKALDHVALTIRFYRKQIEDLCEAELSKAQHQLRLGVDAAAVLQGFAHALTNKLLHYPSVQLRQAGIEGRFEMLQLARQLFVMPECT